MKIIFLDIDGVLNVFGKESDEFGKIFHTPFVDNLKWIIDETGAKIVISSTWRYAGIDKMLDLWSKRNLPGEIIGVTIDCHQIIDEGRFEFYDQVERGHEIQDWIDDHREIIDSYVIIDDDNDMLLSQKNNFVRTANNINHSDSLDLGYGLTKVCAEKAIRILNRS